MLSRLLFAVALGLATVGIGFPDIANAGCITPNGNVKKGMYTVSVQPITAVSSFVKKQTPYLGCLASPVSFTLESIIIVSNSGGWFQFGWTRTRSTTAMATPPNDGVRWWVQIQPPAPSQNVDNYYFVDGQLSHAVMLTS